MKRLLLLLAFGILSGLTGIKAQTQIYFQDFNTGAASEWTLDASIGNLSSTGNGDNYWVINNVYAGNSTFGVNATPNQPAGITGNPNSYYMHVTNGNNNGFFADYNANFLAPESGNEVAAMNTPLVTTGYSAVTLTFWYLCEGGNAHYTGQLYYSTNGGTTWTQEGGTYSGVTSWTQATVTDPNWNNAPSLEFAFDWVQTGGGSATATDPPWAVDDIKLVGTASVAGPPVASFTSSDSVGCQGSCFTFTDNSTNSPTSRVWTFTGGNPPSSTLSPVTVCYANSGTFPVKLVSTNSFGSDSITKATAITIHAKPNAGADQNVTCFPSNSSTTMAGTGTGSWTAEAGNPGTTTITTPTSPTTTITAISAVGTYNFIWTSNGCTDTAAVIVTAKPNAGPDQTVSCVTLPGGSATMAGTGTGTWTSQAGNPGTATITSATSPTTTIATFSTAGTYHFIWTNGGCTDTAAVTVTSKPNAGVDQFVTCYPSNTSATMAGTGTGTWTAEAGNPGTATITAPSSPATTITAISAVGTYNFIWTSGGCTDTAAVIVTAKPNAGPNQTVGCVRLPGGSATMAGTGTGTWTAQAGNPGTATITTASSPTTTITTFSAAGTYNFIWTNGGCTDTAAVVITAKPNAGSDQTICQYTNTALAATGTGTWTAAASNPTVVTITNATSPTTSVTGFNVAGAYSFYWSNGGCSDTVNITVSAKPNAGADQTLCQYESTTLAATGTGTWTVAASNPAVVGFTNTGSPTAVASGFNAAGTYTLYWSLNGCSDTVNINVTAKPNAGVDQDICQFSNVTMTATGSGTWTANGSNPAFSNIVSITSPTTSITGFTQPGAYTFYWSLSGCTDTVVINVGTIPTASITVSGDSLVAMPAGASYQWLNSHVPISGATSQVYVPTVTDSFEVVVTEGGCSDTSAPQHFLYKPNGINNISGANVSIWPNPFNDHIEISLGDMNSATIEIYSILGTKVLSGSYHNQASIDMTFASSGVYIIHVRNDKVDITRMITKQ